MPRVIVLVFLTAALFLVASRSARAAEAPSRTAQAAEHEQRWPAGQSRLEPADWVAAAGIACYIILPAIVLVIGVVVVFHQFHPDWYATVAPGLAMLGPPHGVAPPPPHGLVLLRF